MILLAVIIAITVIIFVKLYENLKRLPPGPWGLPLVGYYPLIGSNITEKFKRLADEYGDIMTLNMLGKNYYYLNSLEVVKDVLIRETNFTTDRSPYFKDHSPFGLTFGKNSLVNASGNAWTIPHKLMLSKLNELGMGKKEMNEKILMLSDKMVAFIRNRNEEAIDIYEILTNFTSNVVSMLFFSRDYDHNDPEYIQLMNDVREFFLCSPGIDGNLSGPLFSFWYKIKGDYFQRITGSRARFLQYFKPIVKERINSVKSGSQEHSDLLDFLVQKNIENAQFFDTETIANDCFVWFLGGTGTISTTLYHGVHLMILYPEIQAKVQREIDSVFGLDKPALYQDRHLLPYTQAVLQEILRYSCVLPFGIEHSNTKELRVRGYTIPERSTLIVNYWKISRDEKLFPNPDDFDPNNFLNPNGEFDNKYANFTFCVGKRRCIGFGVASMELFIAFVTLFQKFNWNPPKGESLKHEIHECQARVLSNFKCTANNRQ